MKQLQKKLEKFSSLHNGIVHECFDFEGPFLSIPHDAFEIVVDYYPYSHGHVTDRFITRYRVALKNPNDLKFTIQKCGLFTRFKKFLGIKGIEIDESFNSLYWYQSNDKIVATRLMGPVTRKLLPKTSFYLACVKEHALDVHAVEGESCLILTLPSMIVDENQMNQMVTLLKVMLDDLVSTGATSQSKARTKLIKE